MKRYLGFFLISIFFYACDNDDNVHTEVPSVVLNAFHRDYANALDVGWRKVDSLYEVNFEIDQRDHTAFLNATGKVVRLKREISLAEIPSSVTEKLIRNFDRKDIEDPEVVEMNGDILYQLELDKVLFDDKVVIDETGTIRTNIPYWD